MQGYSQSGAVDWLNFRLANALCAKNLSSAALEVMGGNVEFTVSKQCLMAITGAHAKITINDKLFTEKTPVVILLDANDHVAIGNVVCGVFSYIAFSVNFELPVFAGSVCAVKRESKGGYTNNGMGLACGDSFIFGSINRLRKCGLNILNKEQQRGHDLVSFAPILQKVITQQMSAHKTIPFSFCYQSYGFRHTEKQRFCAHQYVISQYIDKMGVRLNGPAIECELNHLTSQGVASGSIQIPGDGAPIIMRNDRQTIGGYPIIGSVNSEGLALLSQAQVNNTMVFKAVDFEASTIWQQFIDIQLKRVFNKTKMLFEN
jgi:allophanate hydrolase subunit 2